MAPVSRQMAAVFVFKADALAVSTTSLLTAFHPISCLLLLLLSLLVATSVASRSQDATALSMLYNWISLTFKYTFMAGHTEHIPAMYYSKLFLFDRNWEIAKFCTTLERN